MPSSLKPKTCTACTFSGAPLGALSGVTASAAGFTLIELMVVVGIIGILVTVAGPNYAKYQAKARTSEAKINLAAMYSAEKSFYVEYSAYIAGFDAIGYSPEGDKRFYAYGWGAASNAGVISGYPSAGGTFFIDRLNFPSSWTTCAPTSGSFVGPLPLAATTDPQTMAVSALGQIRNFTGCDGWYIDQNKRLVYTNNGL